MPHLPQPARARGFTAHRAMRRAAKAAPLEVLKVVRRRRSRNLLTAGNDIAVVEVPMLLAAIESGES